jgi:hypothetical protein
LNHDTVNYPPLSGSSPEYPRFLQVTGHRLADVDECVFEQGWPCHSLCLTISQQRSREPRAFAASRE